MSIDAFQGPAFSAVPLRRSMLNDCPFRQFGTWFADAAARCSGYANPVGLGTVDPNGQPVVRTVLLKGYDESGFRFYTNYDSRKGGHLKNNPRASMCLYWEALERQVIILGSVTRLSTEDSDEYFSTRERGSQIGAHISAQSRVIDSREELEKEAARLKKKYAGETVTIPRPKNWGGFSLSPDSIEFWQGQPDRLHDRFIYQKIGKRWQVDRLAP